MMQTRTHARAHPHTYTKHLPWLPLKDSKCHRFWRDRCIALAMLLGTGHHTDLFFLFFKHSTFCHTQIYTFFFFKSKTLFQSNCHRTTVVEQMEYCLPSSTGEPWEGGFIKEYIIHFVNCTISCYDKHLKTVVLFCSGFFFLTLKQVISLNVELMLHYMVSTFHTLEDRCLVQACV